MIFLSNYVVLRVNHDNVRSNTKYISSYQNAQKIKPIVILHNVKYHTGFKTLYISRLRIQHFGQ